MCDDWDNHLKLIQFAHNTSQHSATGMTPFLLMFRVEARTPVLSEFESDKRPADDSVNYSDYLKQLKTILNKSYESVNVAIGNIS